MPEPVPAAPAVVSPAQGYATPVPRPVEVATAPPQPFDKKAGAGLRMVGIVVGAVGVAALGTGVALNLKANSMATDLEKPDNFNRDTDW